MTGQTLVLRGDARHLPLPDASVDLIVTSPPFYALRSYTDSGEHYDGQIGSESSPAAYIDALLECTREWARVLKPAGSLFVNLGDKYNSAASGQNLIGIDERAVGHGRGRNAKRYDGDRGRVVASVRAKSLLLLPERYRIGCVDHLGLIARAVIVWNKPNGLPESVTDRVRRSHEDWVHLTKQPRYYSAVDEIRVPHARAWAPGRNGGHTAFVARGNGHTNSGMEAAAPHALESLPVSVWEIATEPLRVPEHLGLDHFAAFPVEWPRRLVLGWSPPGICLECGEGRRPVVSQQRSTYYGSGRHRSGAQQVAEGAAEVGWAMDEKWRTTTRITGYVCACTPSTGHPATGSTTRRDYSPGLRDDNAQGTYGRHQAGEYERVGPRREYHLDDWTAPPVRPAVVLDPFAGTGTTMLAAKALGRIGVGVDRSADYCRLARWRTTDPGELAKAMRVAKPPPQLDGQDSLFDLASVGPAEGGGPDAA